MRAPNGKVIAEIARPIGTASNNAAEYIALIEGLKLALEHGVTKVQVNVDSTVVYGHLERPSTVKNERLQKYFDEVNTLLGRFDSYDIKRVDRVKNADADGLANQGMDSSSASMFTIHLDLPASSATATCARCLQHHEVVWDNENSPDAIGLWEWMTEHAGIDH